VSLASSAASVRSGQSITLVATVTGDAVTPTGIVQFYEDGTLIGSATVNAKGQAVLTTSSLDTGMRKITAIYRGNSNYAVTESKAALGVLIVFMGRLT
jgi:hypothetical protein